MSISRLNYKFYSGVEETEGILTYRTNFPFIMDQAYYVPDGLTYAIAKSWNFDFYKNNDKIIDYGGNITPFLNYTDASKRTAYNWEIGLSINSTIVYVSGNVLPHIGIEENKTYIGVDDKGMLFGVVVVNKNEFGVIAQDAVVEIVTVYSKTSSPWIYYGLLDQRSKIAESLGRNPLGMGGIPQSLTPCQALKMSYFVDGYVDNLIPSEYLATLRLLTSLGASSTFVPVPTGFDAYFSHIFLTFDVIDGKLDNFFREQVKLRSATNFVVSQQGLNATLLGVSLSTAAVGMVGANYKTINSRRMDYQKKVYKENVIAQDTVYYIVGERKPENNDFYLNLSQSIETFLPNFIDFETCLFKVYVFEQTGEKPSDVQVYPVGNASTKEDLSEYVKSMQSKIIADETYNGKYTPDMSNVYTKMFGYVDEIGFTNHGVIQEDFSNSTITLNYFEKGKCEVLFISDMNFKSEKVSDGNKCVYQSNDFNNSKNTFSKVPTFVTLNFNGEDKKMMLTVKNGYYIGDNHYSAMVYDRYNSLIQYQKQNHGFYASLELMLVNDVWIPSNANVTNYTDKGFVSSVQDANTCQIFVYKSVPYYENAKRDSDLLYTEDNSIALIEEDEFGCYVYNFLRLLNLDTEMEEESLFSELDFDPNIIKENCKLIGFSFSDASKAMINRIKGLYKGSSNVEMFSSYGDKVEMRYWRKKCPIGCLYNITGYISSDGITQYDNSGYWFRIIIGDKSLNKTMLVYVEEGSTSNFSMKSYSANDIYCLQGIVLYAQYFIDSTKASGKNPYFEFDYINGVKFNVLQDLQEWYRLPESTINFLLQQNEPVLIVRSNIFMVGNEIENSTRFPSLFRTDNKEIRYAVFPLIEKINDYISYNPVSVQDKYMLAPTENKVCYSDTEPIVLQTLEFKMASGYDAYIPSNYYDLVKENEYEIRYIPENGSVKSGLWKFKSGFVELKNAYNANDSTTYKVIQVSLYAKKSFKCVASSAYGLENMGKIFDIYTTADSSINNYESGKYIYKQWNPNDWKIRVKVDGVAVQTEYIGLKSSLSQIVYGGNDLYCLVNHFTGQLVFNKVVNYKSQTVAIEMVNVADSPNSDFDMAKLLKSSGYLDIYRCSNAGTQDHHPRIFDIKVNMADVSSVERVECVYYNPVSSYSDTIHYIAPAWGFKTLENENTWIFNPTETQFNVVSGRVNGTVDSPTFFIDYFEQDDKPDKKMLSKDRSIGSLASIDRIVGNITSDNTIPYMEVSCISYDPTELPIPQSRVASVFDETSNKVTIVCNKEKRFIQKSSSLDFFDRDFFVDKNNLPYLRESLNKTMPVISKFIDSSPMMYLNADGSYPQSILLDIADKSKKLIGLEIEYENNTGDMSFGEPVELYDEDGKPVGYKNLMTTQLPYTLSSCLFSEEENAKSYTRLPDVSDLNSLQVVVPNGSRAGSFFTIKGQYAVSYVEGYTPNLYHSSYGYCYLFYLDKKSQRIKCLVSKDDGMTWTRPNYSSNYYKKDEPIIIYKNSYGIKNLLCMNTKNAELFKLFFYNCEKKTINMVAIPERMLDSISEGYEDTAGTSSLFEPQDGYTIFNLGSSVNSWNGVFENEGMMYVVGEGFKDRFGVAETKTGRMFAAVITEAEGHLKIIYTDKIGKGNNEVGTIWTDTKLDLFGYNAILNVYASNLGKFLSTRYIVSISLDYSSETDSILHLYISYALEENAEENYLLYYSVPFAVLGNISDNDKGELLRNQVYINNIKPVLIVGDTLSEVEKTWVISTATQEENSFGKNQMVSTQWTDEGRCLLFYYDNNWDIRSAITYNTQSRWWRFNRV